MHRFDDICPDHICPGVSAGEWFPVKRKLLRHCIALTKVVRSEVEAEVDVTVDVDTDIFDRWEHATDAPLLGRMPPRACCQPSEKGIESCSLSRCSCAGC